MKRGQDVPKFVPSRPPTARRSAPGPSPSSRSQRSSRPRHRRLYPWSDGTRSKRDPGRRSLLGGGIPATPASRAAHDRYHTRPGANDGKPLRKMTHGGWVASRRSSTWRRLKPGGSGKAEMATMARTVSPCVSRVREPFGGGAGDAVNWRESTGRSAELLIVLADVYQGARSRSSRPALSVSLRGGAAICPHLGVSRPPVRSKRCWAVAGQDQLPFSRNASASGPESK